jgi:hypothetical protein
MLMTPDVWYQDVMMPVLERVLSMVYTVSWVAIPVMKAQVGVVP